MLKIILSLSIVVAVLMSLYEYKIGGPYDGYPSLWKILQTEKQGCKELDALSLKERQHALRGNSPKEVCEILFFESRKIDTPATFLTGKQFQTYKDHLAKNECLRAEQVLWLRYKATYSGTPKVDFSKTYDGPLGRWRHFVLTKQVPEVFFCIQKKRFEANHQELLNSNLVIRPIRDLFKTHYVKTDSQFLKERNQSLMLIAHLARLDYVLAQIYIIEQSMKGEVFTLLPSEQYRLLKRLEMLGSLPETLKDEFVKARDKLPNSEVQVIDKQLTSFSFFLISSMPTMEGVER
jgi:hypothetical protein